MKGRLAIAIGVGLLGGMLAWGLAEWRLQGRVHAEAERLASIAAEAAAGIDAAAHDDILGSLAKEL